MAQRAEKRFRPVGWGSFCAYGENTFAVTPNNSNCGRINHLPSVQACLDCINTGMANMKDVDSEVM